MGCGASVGPRDFSKAEHEKINRMLQEFFIEEDVVIEELQMRRDIILKLVQTPDCVRVLSELNVDPISFLDVVDSSSFKEQKDAFVSADEFKELLVNERRSNLAIVSNLVDSYCLLIEQEDPIRIKLEVMGALAATAKSGSRMEHVIVHLEATGRENKENKAKEKAKEEEKAKEKQEVQEEEAPREPTVQDLCGLLRGAFKEFTERSKFLKSVDEKLQALVPGTSEEFPTVDPTAQKNADFEQIINLPSPPVFSDMALPKMFTLKDAVKGKVPKVQELLLMLDVNAEGMIGMPELQSAIQKQECLSLAQDLGVDLGCVFLVMMARENRLSSSDFAQLLWHYQVSNPVLVSHIHDVRRILLRQGQYRTLDLFSLKFEEGWASITGSKGPQLVRMAELVKMFERKQDAMYISRVEVSVPDKSPEGIMLNDVFKLQRVITELHLERMERINKIFNKLDEALTNGSLTSWRSSAQT